MDGSDAFEGDALPSAHHLKLSSEQMQQRTMLVHEFLQALKIPAAYVFGGGYGDQVARIHTNFIRTVF